ncbi:PP2C family protein-serine/threonine phosphatase [Paenibacillus sp. NRS-1760]|uniref:PP2C family protein-serine/threonine phosphatase n=1 Tax=Paenibacillus sp. NRS-1760 TaxID=3233902 RepID=UPI003D2BEF67
MNRRGIIEGLAIVLLLLVIVYIGVAAIPDKQLEQLWTSEQGEIIEIAIAIGMIGFGALLILIIVFDLPAGNSRISNRSHGVVEAAGAETESRPGVAVTPAWEPPPVPLKTPSIEQIVGAANAAAELISNSRNAVITMKVITGHAQHIGEREEQQDAYGFSSLEDEEAIERHGVLAVLADGMGGYAMGKEAGQLAVQTMLNEYIGISAEESIPRALEQSLHLANQAVYEMALSHELEWSVGTTLIATVIHHGELYWISAGDSRIYLFRGGVLMPLTRDHIYANRLREYVLAGNLTQEEAESHPERHLLTSYLGIPRITEIDANQEPLYLLTGDLVILCSDGLYDDLSDKLLEEASCLYPPLAAAFILQHVLAEQRPYQDNATIAILACV